MGPARAMRAILCHVLAFPATSMASMKTLIMSAAETASDAHLVEASLSGDHESFGRIVTRYQSGICALAYCACGNVARSEDLAQEIFITAWRQLRELKEPAKFRAWLYGIARNLLHNAFRRQSRNPLATAEPLEEGLASTTLGSSPPDLAMSREEEAILWRVLEALPETYREPMVLFYRQAEGIAEVAAILDISEETVRQRLSRGRAMLNERVAKLVETGLRRSGPTAAFGLAVLASLPGATAQAAAVGGTASTTQGAGAAKGAGFFGMLAPAAVLGQMAGTVTALWGRVQNTRSSRERRFLAWASWGYLGWALFWIILFALSQRLFEGEVIHLTFLQCALLWLGIVGPVQAYAIWVACRQRRIQLEDGTAAGVPAGGFWFGDPTRKGFRATVYGSLAGVVFWSTAWLAGVGQHTGDKWLLVGLPVVAVAIWLAGAGAILRWPDRRRAIFLILSWGIMFLVLAVVNLRWEFWHRQGPHPQPAQAGALVGVNFLILVVYGSFGVVTWLKPRLVAAQHRRREVTIAAVLYLTVLLGGWGLSLATGW